MLHAFGHRVAMCFDMLSPGQTIATFQHNISQHCWAQHVTCVWPQCCDVLRHVKPRPNDRNIQRNMLRAFGHPVATCWVLLAQI